MSELGTDYIGSKELVFNNDTNLGIHSGGFSVNSIMMKGGMSPIMTINSQQIGGTKEKVSDLFNDLVIPNWALSYNNKLVGGKYNDIEKKINDNYDSDDEIIDDDLHEKLLDLVKQLRRIFSCLRSKMNCNPCWFHCWSVGHANHRWAR
jgi:hypothetical protein